MKILMKLQMALRQKKPERYSIVWDEDMCVFSILDSKGKCISSGNKVHGLEEVNFNWPKFREVLQEQCQLHEIDINSVDISEEEIFF